MFSQFFSFKIYFIALTILFLLFFLSWIPKTEAVLKVSSEPLIMEFDIKIDCLINKTLFNLNTLPGKIVEVKEIQNQTDYYFLEDLKDFGKKRIIIFKKQDLEDLIIYKVNSFLQENLDFNFLQNKFYSGKKVYSFHPEDWEIQVLKNGLPETTAEIKVFLQEEVILNYHQEKILKEICFKKKLWIKGKLESFPGVKEAQLNISPKIFPQTSIFKNRIEILIQPMFDE